MNTPRVAFGATPWKGGDTSRPAKPARRCPWLDRFMQQRV